jgi:hypothetical protein
LMFQFIVGDKMLYECTGIFVKSLNANNTLSVLTSFTLVGYDEGLNCMKFGYRDISRVGAALISSSSFCLAYSIIMT